MATAVILDFEGGTLDQYDDVTRRMGPMGHESPEGALFHWVCKTDAGIRVTDVWESREQFEAFGSSNLRPLLREAGITDEPKLTYIDVHNYLTAGSAVAAGADVRAPVAVVMDFEGGTLDQYDEVIRRMGFHRGGEGAPAGLFHWVCKTDTGLRVTDVWESREAYEAFGSEKIGPITQAVGVPGPPKVEYFDVHNYLTAGAGAPVATAS